MSWPTKEEYDVAIENWRTTLSDPDLRNGQPVYNKHRKFFPLGGANHYVCLYKFDSRDKTRSWIVRCFCTKRDEQNPLQIIDQPPDNIELRYRTLHAFCNSDEGKKISALIPIDYLEKEITVGGKKYPIVKMNFLNALNLGEFIAENYENRTVMQQLSEAWNHMMYELEEAPISHGDIDLTNVLVEQSDSTLTLKLIDYDSLWIPNLKNTDQPVYGHQSFQHPAFFRKRMRPTNAELDRFSALVIYLSIAILTYHPKLYFKCGANEVDRLLFSLEDYNQPNGGRIKEFRDLKIPGIQKYIDELTKALLTSQMPRPLSIIDGKKPTANQLYPVRPPIVDWGKLKLNPKAAPYFPSTELISSLPTPSSELSPVTRSFAFKFSIFLLVLILLTAVGFGVFFLLKTVGMIATVPLMHTFSTAFHPYAASTTMFSFSWPDFTNWPLLVNFTVHMLNFFIPIALASCLISLILYLLVMQKIHFIKSFQKSQFASPQQLQLSIHVTPIEPDLAAETIHSFQKEKVTTVLSQPNKYPEEDEIERRIAEACSQLAQGKPESVIELAIEIQLSYNEFWAKLMNAIADTPTEKIESDLKHWLSGVLEEGKNTLNVDKALRCYITALVLYRCLLNRIPKTTLAAADIWCEMGVAYYHLSIDNLYLRTTNLRIAITCYQIALYLYTFKNIPKKLTRLNRYLGDAYRDMLEEDWTTNLEAAMACYKIALLYCLEGDKDIEWIETNQRLGWTHFTFATHSSDSEREQNLKEARSYYKVALHSCKRNTEIWASIQYDLGLVYSYLNQPQEAASCYNQALEVYTEHNFPEIFAKISYRKGITNAVLFDRTQQQNYLREAQVCYNKALRIYNTLNLSDEAKRVSDSIKQLQNLSR